MRINNIKASLIIGIAFFVIGLITLPHYGINWDTINHLPRGQSYLRYFLTGKKDFSELPAFRWYGQKGNTLFYSPDVPKNELPRISLYQNAGIGFTYFVNNDGGHPPLSDILSSLFNYVLFQKLGWINDIDSYRIYGILLASALVGLLFYWVGKLYGKATGFFAAVGLAFYPLFWSEAHFNNEKDVPEAVYWSFMLFCVWKAVTEKKWKWFILSGISFGLALGTKFNILFIPIIIIPWLLVYVIRNHFVGWRKILIGGLFATFIGLFIFVVTWPYLWPDPITRILSILKFYKDIGITTNVDSRYVWFFGINTYPIQWILFTTPIPLLITAVLGIFYSIKTLNKDRCFITILFLLWFVTPIARVTWPGMTIYGGIRQIMEYVPALAILTGLGVGYIFSKVRKNWIKFALTFLYVMFLIYPIIKIHPNENVYFNQLIGGLSGAKRRDIPSWGNSFGAAYRQGVNWLNENVPVNAHVSYARELAPNIPKIWLRQDIVLHSGYRSGYLKEGEYVIGLTYQGVEKTSYYDRYLDRFLIPVYTVDVDGVSILKIWKNDKEHTKQGYLNETKLKKFTINKVGEGLMIDLGTLRTLSRLESDFSLYNCRALRSAGVSISEDGVEWERLPGTMPREDWSTPKLMIQPAKSHVLIPFAADKARYINISIDPRDACLFNLQNTNVFVLNL